MIMKRILIYLALFVNPLVYGNTYYVATTGNNLNVGTLQSPWRTWNYGFNHINAGDTLFIRGGTYTDMMGLLEGAYFGVRVSAKYGSTVDSIYVLAYPSEVPVLDCSVMTTDSSYHYGILIQNSSYWHIEGLTVKSVHEFESGGSYPFYGGGWEFADVKGIKIINCTVTDCINGFSVSSNIDSLVYVNCDAFLNYDLYDDGGLANGFNGNMKAGSTMFYYGCRSWKNSDDGFDNAAGGGYIRYENCWAWGNGQGDTPTIGDGVGFKLGANTRAQETGVQRRLFKCISANNKLSGFDENSDPDDYPMDMILYNCTSFNDGTESPAVHFITADAVDTIKNCISYKTRYSYNAWQVYQGRRANVEDHNSWDSEPPYVTAADFVSLDYTQLDRKRKNNGNLPDIDFMKLEEGSDLIDAGTDVGYTYHGKAPDLGWYEYNNEQMNQIGSGKTCREK
jgi:hypothetical protein